MLQLEVSEYVRNFERLQSIGQEYKAFAKRVHASLCVLGHSHRDLLDCHLVTIHVGESDVRLGIVAREHLIIVDKHARCDKRAVVACLLVSLNYQRHESVVSVLEAKAHVVSLQGPLQVLLEALYRENSKSLALLLFYSFNRVHRLNFSLFR